MNTILRGTLPGGTTDPAPEIRCFFPDDHSAGTGMVVFPGGGYWQLSAHEGDDYAAYFSAHGIACFVVDYRLAQHGFKHPSMLEDAFAAIYAIRSRAAEFGMDLGRLGVCGSSAGLIQLRAKVFVDATGDADLAFQAGVECTKGRASNGKCQPMTMKMRMMNLDIAKVRAYIKNNPDEFPHLADGVDQIDKAPRISIGGFVKLLAKGKAAGDFTLPRDGILFFEVNASGEVIVNTTRILGYDAIDPWSFNRAEMEGCRQAEEVDRFLKKYIPGFEKSVLIYTGPQIGVRSSRQIKGCYTLTNRDVHSRKVFPDTIAHTGYPVDIHNPDGAAFVEHEKPAWGTFCNIPYRCLVQNMVTVGRCISFDFEAQRAIRTTPTMGAVGQAGGIAAAQVSNAGVAAADIDVAALQEELLMQGGFLALNNGKSED